MPPGRRAAYGRLAARRIYTTQPRASDSPGWIRSMRGNVMKIVCLGGGPGGLYFSILMKKAFPSTDISVIERNRADDTFGWGVVFSEETLGNLEQADPESYRAIH